MNTELYKMLNSLLLDSELSKRAFCKKHEIPHAWFIEFMNPSKPFRPLQVKTQGLLKNHLNIPIKVMNEYNDYIMKERSVKYVEFESIEQTDQ